MTDPPAVTNPAWREPDLFYLEDERREHSIEHTLPGAWFMEDWTAHHLYWLEQTGEIVTIASAPVRQNYIGDPEPIMGRRVELIGWTDTLQKAQATFDGWTGHSGKLKSLYWLRKRAELQTTPAIPGRQVTDEHRALAQAETGSLF